MAERPLSLRACLTLFTAFVVLTVAFAFSIFCWPAVYRPLVDAFHWNFASANAGGAIVLLLIGLLSPFVGIAVDRFKPKAVILAGTALAALGLALLSTMHSMAQYYTFSVIVGMGASAASIIATSILIGPYFSRWRGLAVGFINAGIGLGGYIAPRFATKLILERGIPGMFLTLAACMAIPFVLTLLVVRDSDAPARQLTAARVPTAGELVRMPMFWIFGVSLFFCAHAMLGVQQNLISYLRSEHVAAKDAALALAIALAAAAPGKLISGILADRMSARAGMVFSVVCVALGILALLNTPPQSGLIYWLAVVFGMGYGGIFNASPTIVFEFFGTHQVGRSMGLFYIFFGLGTSSGGELAGHLFDETHRWSVPFTVDLCLAVASLALVLLAHKQTRRVTASTQPALSPS